MKKLLKIITILTFILTGCSNKATQNNEISEKIKENKNILSTTYLETPDFGRPKSQEPINNIFIALYGLKDAASYESTTSGEVIAKKGKTKLTTQTLKNTRVVNYNATFNESISISTFVKVAKQTYVKDNVFLTRDAAKVTNNSVDWENTTTKFSQEQYLNIYGYSPTEPLHYIINEETIIDEIEIVNNGIGRKFTYKFNLDPQIAPYYYATNVKSLSSSTTNPTFKSIEMQITFDYKWRITKIEVQEEYEVNIKGIGTITCFASITETFKNINKSISIPNEHFFEKQL